MKMTVGDIHEALWCMASDDNEIGKEIKSIIDGKITFADGTTMTLAQGISRFEKEVLGIY